MPLTLIYIYFWQIRFHPNLKIERAEKVAKEILESIKRIPKIARSDLREELMVCGVEVQAGRAQIN
jgi:hypothetical protein